MATKLRELSENERIREGIRQLHVALEQCHKLLDDPEHRPASSLRTTIPRKRANPRRLGGDIFLKLRALSYREREMDAEGGCRGPTASANVRFPFVAGVQHEACRTDCWNPGGPDGTVVDRPGHRSHPLACIELHDRPAALGHSRCDPCGDRTCPHRRVAGA